MDILSNIMLSLLRWSSLAFVLLASPMALSQESDEEAGSENPDSLVLERIRREREVKDNRSVLLPHRRNYFLPLTWASQPNNVPFQAVNNGADEFLDQLEAQFQLSLKVPLAEGLFSSADALYASFTVRAFWQAYNSDISSPFRETNYEPELFWMMPVPWKILGGDASLFALGLSHQSNGRSQSLSRSWNRIYANLIWERNRFVFSFKPWWRIPEDEKTDPLQPDGDDNPDIEDFMGNFEFTTVYRNQNQEFSLMLRNNLDRDDNKGAVQLDWTFPLSGRLRGYAQIFSGYGESLIDYNARIERIGIGILLSDLL